MKISRTAYNIASVFVLAGICFTGYKLYDVYRGYERAESEYAALRESYRMREGPEVTVQEEDLTEYLEENVVKVRPWGDFPEVSVDVDGLYEENEDFYAWLYFADGKVDHPVMQEPEGEEYIDYYLRRGFDKKKLSAGCLFASNELPFDTTFSNFYIYGHNMTDGTMFGSLDDVYNDDLAGLTDPYFYLYTRDHERVKYRVLSMYDVSEDDTAHYNAPATPDMYDDYIDLVLASGSVLDKFPLTAWEEECLSMRSQICTLYACYGRHGVGKRLFVHGVEIGREGFEPAAETGGDAS